MNSSIDPSLAPEQRREHLWKLAYAARTKDDLRSLYREWADSYDEDHAAVGFAGHESVAEVLARHTAFRRVAPVLDAGAGTGAAGVALARRGFRNLTAIDLSTAMLEKAAEKGVYVRLDEADLGLPLDQLPCNSFDAAVMVGVFSYGQAPAHTLDEIVRVVRPGGVIAFTLRLDFFEADAMRVRSKMEELDRAQHWKLVELTEPDQYLPLQDPDAMFRVWCYRVLETKRPPVDEEFATAVREAFTHGSKVYSLDHSFIWDSVASRLYDDYTECEGYYLTDREIEILETHAAEILGDDDLLVELGCGSARKVSHLLQAATERSGQERLVYAPVDVSQGALDSTQAELEAQFDRERVEIAPRCGRFDEILASIPVGESKLITFFGSSLGNLESLEQTVTFLRTIRDRMGLSDRFVVGLDLHKGAAPLRAAYEAGPRNRRFFLNMLRRMNRELGANFDLERFEQSSPYEADPSFHGLETSCVQLRLVTSEPQNVYVESLHMEVKLEAGDAVQVGTSRKFRPDDIRRLGRMAGLDLRRQWFDERRDFSLNEFVRCESDLRDVETHGERAANDGDAEE